MNPQDQRSLTNNSATNVGSPFPNNIPQPSIPVAGSPAIDGDPLQNDIPEPIDSAAPTGGNGNDNPFLTGPLLRGGQRGQPWSLATPQGQIRGRGSRGSSPTFFTPSARRQRLEIIQAALESRRETAVASPAPQLTRFSTSVVVASGTPGSYRNPIAISPTPPLGSRRNPLVIPPTPTPPPGSRHQPSSIFADLSRAQLDTIIAIYRAFKISNQREVGAQSKPITPNRRDVGAQTERVFLISALSSPVERGSALYPSLTSQMPANNPGIASGYGASVSNQTTPIANRRPVVRVIDSDDEDLPETYLRLPRYPVVSGSLPPSSLPSSSVPTTPESYPLSTETYLRLPRYPVVSGSLPPSSLPSSSVPTTPESYPLSTIDSPMPYLENTSSETVVAAADYRHNNIYEGYEPPQAIPSSLPPAVEMVGPDSGVIVMMVEDQEEFFDASSSHGPSDEDKEMTPVVEDGSDDYFSSFPNFDDCPELDNILELM